MRVQPHKCSPNKIRHPKKKIIVISCYELLSNPMYSTNLAPYLFLENECTVLRRGVVRKWKLPHVNYLFRN
jgi:hypothetical protein